MNHLIKIQNYEPYVTNIPPLPAQQQTTMEEPGGQGPWFAALLVNISHAPAEGRRQTRLVSHTYPHLALDVLNRGESKWIIMRKVGPFEVWTDCTTFVSQWACKIRGPERHVKRGQQLYDWYARSHRLHCWSNDTRAATGIARKRARSPHTVLEETNGNQDNECKTIGAIKVGCLHPAKKYK